MALDAVSLMRARVRGTPSWPGHDPETGYVGADRSDHSQKLLADGAVPRRSRARGRFRAPEDPPTMPFFWRCPSRQAPPNPAFGAGACDEHAATTLRAAKGAANAA